VANPDDAEFAKKTEREKGEWHYSLIIEDPLFNPRARKKLEENKRAMEGYSAKSDSD